MRPKPAPGLWACLLLCLAVLCCAPPASAQAAHPTEVAELQVDRTEDGLFLTATVHFPTPVLVEDALLKGIPIFFVAEVKVLRERWYWMDQKVGSVTRYMRLVYQPLTRRWRLNVSPTPIGNSGLGVTFSQTFDDMGEAISAVQRVSRWKVAEAGAVDAEARHQIEFRFRLDTSQLPQPFQIGVADRSDWNLSVTRTVQLPPEAPP